VNEFGFTGRYLDKETGLWYFRARYYSGSLGRFVGRDSITKNAKNGIGYTEAGMGYYDGYNLYAAYFVPNELDPSGGIKCCTKVQYRHSDGTVYSNAYDCSEHQVSNTGITSAIIGGLSAIPGAIGGGLLGAGVGAPTGPGAAATTAAGAGIGGTLTMGAGLYVYGRISCTKECAQEVPSIRCQTFFDILFQRDFKSCSWKDCCPSGSTEW